MRSLITNVFVILVAASMAIVATTTAINLWLIVVPALIVLLIFFAQGWAVIPADPPHKGVLLLCGKRQNVILNEGWCFLPFRGILFDVILIKVIKINQNIKEQSIRTLDLAEVDIDISITWVPGCYREGSPERESSFLTFLNSGKESRVKEILQDTVHDRVRSWAISGEEGPKDWVEAMGA